MTAQKMDVALVQALIADQFPDFREEPIRPVVQGGVDNRTFHLGADKLVRLPSAQGYAAQVEKEQTWLPKLAPALPLPIPVPLGWGQPGCGYPWPWSIYGWIPGSTPARATMRQGNAFALRLADFLKALQGIDAQGAPPPGPHNYLRGAPLDVYAQEAFDCLQVLGAKVDGVRARAVIEAALASSWPAPPVWIHGDLAASNLLVRGGELCAVIDFGLCAAGDPACDLAIAYTLLDSPQRRAFRAALALDEATWERGRGWVVWKALFRLREQVDGESPEDSADVWREQQQVLDAVFEDIP